MDLEHTLYWTEVSPDKLIEALASIEGLRGIDVDPETTLSPSEALQSLQESVKEVEREVASFINALPATGEPLTNEKQITFKTLSPNLIDLKEEFRLPARIDVRPCEGEGLRKAWENLMKSYVGTAETLLKTTVEMKKSRSNGHPSTLEWKADEIQQVLLCVRLATTRLLITGIFIKQVYGLVLAKSELEFGHSLYSQAFEALNAHRITKGLKQARCRARTSSKIRNEALVLMEKEMDCYKALEIRWLEEIKRWDDRGKNMGYSCLEEHKSSIDRTLGTSSLINLLPGMATVTNGLLIELLDFLPKIEDIRKGLPNHEDEAGRASDMFYEKMKLIKDGLIETGFRSITSAKEEHRGSDEPLRTLSPYTDGGRLSHEIISLSLALEKLQTAYKTSREVVHVEGTMEMLRARMEVIKDKKNSMSLHFGIGEEIERAYRLINSVEEVIVEVTTFIAVEERKKRKKEEKGQENEGITLDRGRSIKCAFRNCLSIGHHTRKCNKNLKPGRVPEGIIQMCTDADLCPRCLRDTHYLKHDETCVGGYKRMSDNKWIGTDCGTCTHILSSGKRIQINKRICNHVTGEAKGGKLHRKNLTITPTHPKSDMINAAKNLEHQVSAAPVCLTLIRPAMDELQVGNQCRGEVPQLTKWVQEGGGSQEFQDEWLKIQSLGEEIIQIITKMRVKDAWNIAPVVGYFYKNEKGSNIDLLLRNDTIPPEEMGRGTAQPRYIEGEVVPLKSLGCIAPNIGRKVNGEDKLVSNEKRSHIVKEGDENEVRNWYEEMESGVL